MVDPNTAAIQIQVNGMFPNELSCKWMLLMG